MLLLKTFLLLHLLYEVICFDTSDLTWRDMNNNKISVAKYCKDKNCIVKCCANGEIIRTKTKKSFCVAPSKKEVRNAMNVFNTGLLNGTHDGITDKDNNTWKHRKQKVFINSDVCMDPHRTSSPPYVGKNLIIYENGTSSAVSCPEQHQYCVDLVYIKTIKNISSSPVPTWELILVYQCSINNDPYAKHAYVSAAMLTSSFFMALVLIVYFIIPNIRRQMKNKILLAYLFSQICGYIFKSAQALALNADAIGPEACRLTSPAIYFFFLSSCLWLNAYSFILWWDLGDVTRSLRSVPIRFRSFCLYAWGFPTLLTLIVVAVDRLKWYHNDHYKPPFDSCFTNEISTGIYLHGPIALHTAINCVLFCMTVRYIWTQKKDLKKIRRSKEKKNRFLPFKLSLLMGICWLFELIPNLPLEWHIIANLFYGFTGIFIFIHCVLNKFTLWQLCDSLNLKCSFVEKIKPIRYTYNEPSRQSAYRSQAQKRSTSTANNATELTVLKTIEESPNAEAE